MNTIAIYIYIHLLQRSVVVLLRQKVYVSGGDNADQLAAHPASLCYGDPRETMARLCLKHVPHCVSGTHHHRICNKALLKFLARTKETYKKVYND